jgi:hypothetical protein
VTAFATASLASRDDFRRAMLSSRA